VANPAFALWQLHSTLARGQMQRLSPAATSAVLITVPDAQRLATDEFIDVPLPGGKSLRLQRVRVEQHAERNGLASSIAWFAFTNSQMSARFRLAGVRFTPDVDAGTASAELNWVSTNAQVATWRNDVKADLVSVIAEFSDACGVGYLMNQLGTGFAGSAFQATARSCAVGNLSYPHEHGHNMGLMHDPGNGGNTLFPYTRSESGCSPDRQFDHKNLSGVVRERLRHR
jgi:hypothetical protein